MKNIHIWCLRSIICKLALTVDFFPFVFFPRFKFRVWRDNYRSSETFRCKIICCDQSKKEDYQLDLSCPAKPGVWNLKQVKKFSRIFPTFTVWASYENQVLHTVCCNISGEATGEIHNWSLQLAYSKEFQTRDVDEWNDGCPYIESVHVCWFWFGCKKCYAGCCDPNVIGVL